MYPSSERPRYYSPLYRNFRSINPKDHQRIIREYEYQEKQIGQLDAEEHFELTVWYVDALFATGAHRRHLLMVDLVIFASIDRNIQFLNGQDVYERMLFRKAASAYRIQDYVLCAHICRELIRMYPNQATYPALLTRALFKQQAAVIQFGRGAAIFGCLLTALVIVVDILIVKNFYPAEHPFVIWLRNIVFLFGLLSLAGAYALAQYRAKSEVSRYTSTIKQKAKQS